MTPVSHEAWAELRADHGAGTGGVGEDTTLAQIIKMVSDAAATKAPIAKIADTVSGFFVPAVISIAVLTTIVWLLLDRKSTRLNSSHGSESRMPSSA